MYKTLWAKMSRLAFCVLLPLLMVCASQAQLKMTDNFNRPDGVVGLGWSSWGNGAQISSDQLATFGEIDVAGGIERTFVTTFPLGFSFDFSTDDPVYGGWLVGFNAAGANVLVAEDTSEVELRQSTGSTAVCTVYQTSTGPSYQCANTVSGQRDFTAKADIAAIINADFSAVVRIEYNDGEQPNEVTIKTSAPAGAILTPVGSVLWLGNVSESYGPHFFDNFLLGLN
jgi:hypothetical protein